MLKNLPKRECLERAFKDGVPFLFEEAQTEVVLTHFMVMNEDTDLWGFLGTSNGKEAHGYLDYEHSVGGLTIEEV